VSMGSMIRSAVWLHDENFPCIDKLEWSTNWIS
jgi:hypothetical protein